MGWINAITSIAKMPFKGRTSFRSKIRSIHNNSGKLILISVIVLALRTLYVDECDGSLLGGNDVSTVNDVNTVNDINTVNDAGLEELETLYGYTQLMDHALNDKSVTPLMEIRRHLKILLTRKFPTKVRPDECHGCMEYKFRNIINPSQVCRRGQQIVLFIVITTVPSEEEERQTVRNTVEK